jgi:hypothetical protein
VSELPHFVLDLFGPVLAKTAGDQASFGSVKTPTTFEQLMMLFRDAAGFGLERLA